MIRTLLLLGALMAALPALACPIEAVQRAIGPDQAAAAYRGMLDAGVACSGAQRDWAARIAAAFYVNAAQRLLATDGTPQATMAMLETGLDFRTIWQGLALRGDIRQRLQNAAGRPEYARASYDYQAALNEIAEGDPQTDPVPTPLIASIWRKAEQTRLLAGQVVPSPPTRSGQPGGLDRRTVRSFEPEAHLVPLQFAFDSVVPTSAGQHDFDQLAAMLEQQRRPTVTLIGHTDRSGPPGREDAYNMDLSLRRAMEMKRLLVARGYPARRIRAEGHGLRDPLVIEDRDGYSAAEVAQMLRRVEIRQP